MASVAPKKQERLLRQSAVLLSAPPSPDCSGAKCACTPHEPGKERAPRQASRAVLTAIEGHLVACAVQGLPTAGGAPGRGPWVCVGAGPGLHLLLQNQPANSTLELGVGPKQDEVRRKQRTLTEQAWEKAEQLMVISLYPGSLPPCSTEFSFGISWLFHKWSCGLGGPLMVGPKTWPMTGLHCPGHSDWFSDGQMAPAEPPRAFHGTLVGVAGTHLFFF